MPHSLYVHIPFCQTRCAYCDFNTYAGMGEWIAPYVDALCREAQWMARHAAARLDVHTLFFGGGTPSLLGLADYQRLNDVFRTNYNLLPNLEWTIEANPGSITPHFLKGLRALGVNRLSLGMQSARAEEQRLLGRRHTFADVVQAVGWAREAGFDNLNLDLIFGLPGQTPAAWADTLEHALSLAPEHLSLYSLTIEDGTPLARQIRRGEVPPPDEDVAGDLYELSMDYLTDAGFVQYEISNFARNPSLFCQHNLQYWHNQPYLGLGAGAHGYLPPLRVHNVNGITEYIQRMLGAETGTFPISPATLGQDRIGAEDEMGETMMVGLRLTQEGVRDAGFTQRFGKSLQAVYGKTIKRLIQIGLLEWYGPETDLGLRLTRRGRLLGNQVFMQFI